MRLTVISLSIAAAYGGLAATPHLFGVLGLVHWRHASDSPFDWGNYFTGDKP